MGWYSHLQPGLIRGSYSYSSSVAAPPELARRNHDGGSTRQTYPVSSAPFVGGSGTRGHRSSGAALPEDDHVPLPVHVSLLTTSTHTSGLLPTPCRCEAFFTIKMMLGKSGSYLVRDQPALLQKVATRKRLRNSATQVTAVGQ